MKPPYLTPAELDPHLSRALHGARKAGRSPRDTVAAVVGRTLSMDPVPPDASIRFYLQQRGGAAVAEFVEDRQVLRDVRRQLKDLRSKVTPERIVVWTVAHLSRPIDLDALNTELIESNAAALEWNAVADPTAALPVHALWTNGRLNRARWATAHIGLAILNHRIDEDVLVGSIVMPTRRLGALMGSSKHRAADALDDAIALGMVRVAAMAGGGNRRIALKYTKHDLTPKARLLAAAVLRGTPNAVAALTSHAVGYAPHTPGHASWHTAAVALLHLSVGEKLLTPGLGFTRPTAEGSVTRALRALGMTGTAVRPTGGIDTAIEALIALSDGEPTRLYEAAEARRKTEADARFAELVEVRAAKAYLFDTLGTALRAAGPMPQPGSKKGPAWGNAVTAALAPLIRAHDGDRYDFADQLRENLRGLLARRGRNPAAADAIIPDNRPKGTAA